MCMSCWCIPTRPPALKPNPSLLAELAAFIQQVGEKSGWRFNQAPRVYVSPNAEIPRDALDVVARISQGSPGETAELTSRMGSDQGTIPPHAFLIVNGVRIYSLEKSVVNIGRRDDNDLVIDDPRVSRSHAQLRASHGNFILFDLDSKGGSFVNGQRVAQKVLVPQDVISLAGVPLVYSQETGEPAALDQTQEMGAPPASGPLDEPFSSPQEASMAGIVFLLLRFLLALSLYVFLGWALLTLWRDLKNQGELLASRKSAAIELTLLEGDQQDTRLFKVSGITIGRDPACECVVASVKVSANHARLSYHHNQWWLEDLDSTNGSFSMKPWSRYPRWLPMATTCAAQMSA